MYGRISFEKCKSGFNYTDLVDGEFSLNSCFSIVTLQMVINEIDLGFLLRYRKFQRSAHSGKPSAKR